jgi:hypothetical protein
VIVHRTLNCRRCISCACIRITKSVRLQIAVRLRCANAIRHACDSAVSTTPIRRVRSARLNASRFARSLVRNVSYLVCVLGSSRSAWRCRRTTPSADTRSSSPISVRCPRRRLCVRFDSCCLLIYHRTGKPGDEGFDVVAEYFGKNIFNQVRNTVELSCCCCRCLAVFETDAVCEWRQRHCQHQRTTFIVPLITLLIHNGNKCSVSVRCDERQRQTSAIVSINARSFSLQTFNVENCCFYSPFIVVGRRFETSRLRNKTLSRNSAML